MPDPTYEKCEWNPDRDAPATIPDGDGDCRNAATLSVGSYHLCEGCAGKSRWARHKKKALSRSASASEVALR